MVTELLTPFASHEWGSVDGLHVFAWLPDEKLERLRGAVMDEDWGSRLFVLRKYLAVNVRQAIDQDRYKLAEDTLVLTAGRLQNRYGIPVYLRFERNRIEGRQPWYLRWLGDETVVHGDIPEAPDFGTWQPIPTNLEFVVAHEHILSDHRERVEFLSDVPPVAQICAIAGAIQWAIHRRLEVRQLYGKTKQYLVPVYLQSRENIGKAPDLVATVEVQSNRLLARTVLPPHSAYRHARSVYNRVDELPPWLLDAWHRRPEDDNLQEADSPMRLSPDDGAAPV